MSLWDLIDRSNRLNNYFYRCTGPKKASEATLPNWWRLLGWGLKGIPADTSQGKKNPSQLRISYKKCIVLRKFFGQDLHLLKSTDRSIAIKLPLK